MFFSILTPFKRLAIKMIFMCTLGFGLLTNGILGSVTGKVGGVVGSKWKGRNTLRGYAKPGNPNTTAQQTQRGLFSFVIEIAKYFTSSIISDYWNPFASTISGFNAFCKANLNSVTTNVDYPNLKISQGSLDPAPITSATYNTPNVDFVWSTAAQGNGSETDVMVGIVIDSVNKVAFVDTTFSARVDGGDSLNVGAGRTAADLKAYLFAVQGSGSSMIVSNSIFEQVV